MAKLAELIPYQQMTLSSLGDAPTEWALPSEASLDAAGYNEGAVQVFMDTFTPSSVPNGTCRFVVQGSNDRENFADIASTQIDLITPAAGGVSSLNALVELTNFPRYLRGKVYVDPPNPPPTNPFSTGTVNVRVIISLSKR